MKKSELMDQMKSRKINAIKQRIDGGHYQTEYQFNHKGKLYWFRLTSTYTGAKQAHWCDNNDRPINKNHHIIQVETIKNGANWSIKTKSDTSFDFWASIAHPVIVDRDGLMGAFTCFIDDALTGDQYRDADEIAAEFGYDQPSDAQRVYDACRQSLKDALALLFPEGNKDIEVLYALSDELRENLG